MQKILVVDDDSHVRKNVVRLLEKRGFDVSSASNSTDAAELIKTEDFKVIVTDMVMENDEAGLSVLQAAREKDESTEVIIITAYGNVQNAFYSSRQGAFAYIEKDEEDPYELICSKVEEALKSSNLLIVDDEHSPRKNMARLLEKCGHYVLSASNASEAIDLIKANNFDVVVTDMHIENDEAGLSVLRAAKEKDTSTEVIVMTAYGRVSNAVISAKEGAFSYIEKDADDSYDLLCSNVEAALRNRGKIQFKEVEKYGERGMERSAAFGRGEFDVFFVYNNEDKLQIEEIAEKLKTRGLGRLNLLAPGNVLGEEIEYMLPSIKSVVTFVGKRGIGPWQDEYISELLRGMIRRKPNVVLVFLPECPEESRIPLFLKRRISVDFRNAPYPDAIEALVRGIIEM